MKIYFIQQGMDGPIKVGISWDVKKRFDHMKTFPPTLANKGKIPSVKINGMIYFKQSEIEVWIRNIEQSLDSPQVGRVGNLTP